MTVVERIANDIAMLSNQSLRELTDVLTRDYPTRADALEQAIAVAYREQMTEIYRELGIDDVE
jgi:uncharacterized NAD(P)/FAD-binding protein YdhS